MSNYLLNLLLADLEKDELRERAHDQLRRLGGSQRATDDPTGYSDGPNPVYPPLEKVAEDPVSYGTASAAKPGERSGGGGR